jgi:hypothetical protein
MCNHINLNYLSNISEISRPPNRQYCLHLHGWSIDTNASEKNIVFIFRAGDGMFSETLLSTYKSKRPHNPEQQHREGMLVFPVLFTAFPMGQSTLITWWKLQIMHSSLRYVIFPSTFLLDFPLQHFSRDFWFSFCCLSELFHRDCVWFSSMFATIILPNLSLSIFLPTHSRVTPGKSAFHCALGSGARTSN